MRPLTDLLLVQFPNGKFDPNDPSLSVNSFPQWDSTGHFNFLLLIEEEYAIQFSDEELAELKTLNAIASSLRSKGVSGAS